MRRQSKISRVPDKVDTEEKLHNHLRNVDKDLQNVFSHSNSLVCFTVTNPKSYPYQVTSNDVVIRMSGKSTANLPKAIGSGKFYYFKNVGANTVTVDAGVGSLIDDTQTKDLVSPYDSMGIYDGAVNQWDILFTYVIVVPP